MRANLGLTRGLIMAEAVQMALGAKLGRQQAHELVERASKRAVAEGRELRRRPGRGRHGHRGAWRRASWNGCSTLPPISAWRRAFVDRALAAARDSRGEA